MEITQYDVVLVNLDPTQGSEIKKTRPCVVVSPDELNRHMKTIVVTPMTTSLINYPTRIAIKFKKKTGRIAIDQIRTIDRRRLIKKLGRISSHEIQNLKTTMSRTFVE